MEDYGVAKGYLELDTSSLEGNVKSAIKALDDLERKGALVDSEFNELQSQSGRMGNAFQQAETRVKALSTQISQAEKRCGMYRDEIESLNKIIDTNKKKQTEWTEKVKVDTAAKEKAESKQKELSAAYRSAVKELDAAAEKYGKNSKEVKELENRHASLIQSYKKAEKAVSQCTNTLTQHENELESYGIEIEQSGYKITEFQTKLNNARADINRMNRDLSQAKSSASQWGQYMQDTGNRLQNMGDKLNGWGTVATVAITTPLVAAGAYAVKTAVDFESAFTGVTKTVDGTATELKTLEQGIIDMSKEIPSTTTEIAAVAEAAGQLGIQTPNILGFTRTMIDLGNSTNLSAEEGAASLAQFANVSGMAQDKFSNLGSTIVDLGNNFATTEADIVSMGSRLVGAGSQVGMSEAQILGFATALSSVGIEAEAGGTAFSTLMSEIQLAVETGGESLNQFAEVSGITAEQFQQYFRKDAAGAILSFVEGLSTCEDRGISAIRVLDEMGLSDVRMRDALLRAAGASDVFSEAISVGTNAWEENVALTNEAEKRYDTTASKIDIAKNRIAESARVTGEQMLPVAAEAVDGLADMAEQFGELDPEMQQTIIKSLAVAAAIGPITKVVGTTARGVGTLTEGFGRLLKSVGKADGLKKAGSAIGDLGVNAVASTSGVNGIMGSLKALAGPFGVAALATGAVLGLSTAFGVARKKARESDLEEHFGDIKLSAEEVEDVAERITTNDWTMRIDAVIDAKEKLESLESEIADTVELMDKTEWKIGIGLELTEEEKADYKQSVTGYIQGVQSYIEQQQYTAKLAVDTIFEPGSEVNANFQASSSAFYESLSGELTALGTELSELVNRAWEDNVLSEEELNAIDEKKAEIQKKLDEIAQAEYDLEMDSIHVDAPKGSLDADSFKDLQKELNEKLDEREEELENSKRTLLLEWQMKYNRGEISLDELEAKKQEVDLYASQQFGDLTVDSVNVQLREIKGNYDDKISESLDEFTDKFIQQLKNNSNGGNVDWGPFWDSLTEGYKYGSSTLKGASRENVKELLEAMKPQIQDLEEIAEACKAAGQTVPENINAGLMDYYQLEAMTGNTDHMYELLAGEIANSPELQETVAQAKKSGMTIPEELATALRENYGLVYDGVSGMFEQAIPDETIVETISEGLRNTGLQLSDSFIQSILAQNPIVQSSAMSMLEQVSGGVALTAPQIQSLMSLCGSDIGSALATSIASKSPEVQMQAISLLSQLNVADNSQKGVILAQLSGLGLEYGATLSSSVSSSQGTVESASRGVSSALTTTMKAGVQKDTSLFQSVMKTYADQGVRAANDVTGSAELDPPGMIEPDWTSEALTGRNGMQSTLDNNPLSITVNMKKGSTDGIPGYAYGGIATEPSIFGEDGPEMAIPLSVEKRSRALELYEKTGEILGVTEKESKLRRSIMETFAMSYQIEKETGGGAVVFNAPDIDYDLLSDKIAEKMARVMKNTPIQPIIEMKDGDVLIDNERAGRKLAPVISRVISQSI